MLLCPYLPVTRDTVGIDKLLESPGEFVRLEVSGGSRPWLRDLLFFSSMRSVKNIGIQKDVRCEYIFKRHHILQ